MSDNENKYELLSGANLHNTPVKVIHSELKRADNNSIFRSICPVCEIGILLVKRDNITFKITAEDHCILCGQQYVYTDIDELKKKAGEL